MRLALLGLMALFLNGSGLIAAEKACDCNEKCAKNCKTEKCACECGCHGKDGKPGSCPHGKCHGHEHGDKKK